MTHARTRKNRLREDDARKDRLGDDRPIWLRNCEGLADIDDLMRQLCDLTAFPVLCRRRECRATERCRGGYGPPCLFEYPGVFAGHVKDGMRELRRFWKRQRELNAKWEARERAEGRVPPAGQGEGGAVQGSWPRCRTGLLRKRPGPGMRRSDDNGGSLV